jgi:PPP family 3-phenylpropionic acid transporter
MLKISAFAFVGKVFFTYLATSVGFIYIAFLFQLISFPFFLSASVHLVDEVMEKGEAVKGQSMLTGMMTLSAVFGSLIGGVVLDVSGPSILLFYSTIVTVIGVVILMLSVDRVKSKKV